MEKEYYLIDLERSIGGGRVYYWKAHKRGYTTDLNEAGLYSDLTAGEIVDGDFDRLTVKVEKKKAEDLAGINRETAIKAGLAFQKWKEEQVESDEDGITMTIPDQNGLFDNLRKALIKQSINDNHEALKKMKD